MNYASIYDEMNVFGSDVRGIIAAYFPDPGCLSRVFTLAGLKDQEKRNSEPLWPL